MSLVAIIPTSDRTWVLLRLIQCILLINETKIHALMQSLSHEHTPKSLHVNLKLNIFMLYVFSKARAVLKFSNA